jgi:hypothetical protein
MEVPARFLRVSPTHKGVPSVEGWLEIDLKALDLDGVSKLYVNLADVARVKGKRDAAAAVLDAWDAAFGKREEPAE